MRGKSVVWCPTAQMARAAGTLPFSRLASLQHHPWSPGKQSVSSLTTGQLTASSDTVVTSVPQMHLLNAEIDISTKAKILCCTFLSCHYLVSYCKIIVCPNLHYKMFFPT